LTDRALTLNLRVVALVERSSGEIRFRLFEVRIVLWPVAVQGGFANAVDTARRQEGLFLERVLARGNVEFSSGVVPEAFDGRALRQSKGHVVEARALAVLWIGKNAFDRLPGVDPSLLAFIEAFVDLKRAFPL